MVLRVGYFTIFGDINGWVIVLILEVEHKHSDSFGINV